MFLDKHNRFLRHYRFTFAPRKRRGPAIPLIGSDGEASILDALQAGVSENRALDVRPNGDIIEMMEIDVHAPTGAVVALLHRASPNAADPMYRKKARRGYTVRTVDRKPDEDQSVSAHLIIRPDAVSEGVYDAILEEIPGLSMSLVQPVLGKVLRDYEYSYTDHRGKDDSTHIVFKPRGVKSETVTNALRTGHLGNITLSRPARAAFIDSSDLFTPVDEKMKIKVKGEVTHSDWMSKLGSLATRAREAGWEDFQVDIELDDERTRRVPISRGEEAKEILFIRSAEINIVSEMPVCSTSIIDEFVEKALKAI